MIIKESKFNLHSEHKYVQYYAYVKLKRIIIFHIINISFFNSAAKLYKYRGDLHKRCP